MYGVLVTTNNKDIANFLKDIQILFSNYITLINQKRDDENEEEKMS